MRKLLRANFYSLRKSRALWLCMAGAFVFSAFFMLRFSWPDCTVRASRARRVRAAALAAFAARVPAGNRGRAGRPAAHGHEHADLHLIQRPRRPRAGRPNQQAASGAAKRASEAAMRRRGAENRHRERLPRPAHAAHGHLRLSRLAGSGIALGEIRALPRRHPRTRRRDAAHDGGASALLRRRVHGGRAAHGARLPERRP